MDLLKYTWDRSKELGRTFGLKEGWKHFKAENGEIAALGVIVTFGAVVISLYLVGLITGKIGSLVVPNGGPAQNPFQLNASWYNTTVTLDQQAQSSMGLGNILPVAVIGIGILGLVIGGLFRQ